MPPASKSLPSTLYASTSLLYLYPSVLSPPFLVLAVRLTNLNLSTKDCAAQLDYDIEATMHLAKGARFRLD